MKKAAAMLFGLFILMVLAAGCGEKAPEKATVTISGPAGMTVTINEQAVGIAPVTLRLIPGRYFFKFKAPGYERKWQMIEFNKPEERQLKVNLQPEHASVLISTNPAGAQLVVDGKVLGATPLVLENVLPGREYEGQLRMPGYAERLVKWSVENDRPKQVLIDLDANIVKVEFLSKPAKAQLFINGKQVGVTPYKGELTEGKYTLRFEYPGFSPLEQSVTLSRGEMFRRDYALTALPGGVTITSVPEGAEIFINNVKRGVTPCTLAGLEPAIYEIRAERAGFDPVTRTVEITSGYKDEIRLVMLSSTGALEFEVRPAGVHVSFDGKELGRSEESDSTDTVTKVFRVMNLSPGKHTITVAHSRATPPSRDIEVEIVKGQLARPKPIDVWIANCEIKYKDGQKEVGALFMENDKIILFGPEPGVRYEIKKSDLESIKKLEIGE